MPPATPPDEIITTLRTTRQRRGITQDTIAYATGVDRTSVTGWENGRADLPLARLRAWAAALDYQLTLTPVWDGHHPQALDAAKLAEPPARPAQT